VKLLIVPPITVLSHSGAEIRRVAPTRKNGGVEVEHQAASISPWHEESKRSTEVFELPWPRSRFGLVLRGIVSFRFGGMSFQSL
jgi:hypothetical protein